jgi:hypothetical protein
MRDFLQIIFKINQNIYIHLLTPRVKNKIKYLYHGKSQDMKTVKKRTFKTATRERKEEKEIKEKQSKRDLILFYKNKPSFIAKLGLRFMLVFRTVS